MNIVLKNMYEFTKLVNWGKASPMDKRGGESVVSKHSSVKQYDTFWRMNNCIKRTMVTDVFDI